MPLHPALLILLAGLLFVLAFGGLTLLRRQGLSMRFAIEGLVLTLAGALLVYASVPLHPLFFVVVLYIVTVRVRLLVDLGNWFTSRRQYERSLAIFRLALRLWPDAVSRQIVLINRGATELKMGQPEEAYRTLGEALAEEPARPGALYLAAGHYNLGLAARRTGREAEAIRRFNETIDALPSSIYAHAARQALKEKPPADRVPGDERR